MLSFALGHFENLKHQLFDFGRAHARGRAFHRDGAVAERLRIETRTLQLIGDARIFDLLAGRQIEQNRHQKLLAFHAALRLLAQHFLEQNALVRHVLIDDPQAIAPGRDDEAVVNLAERPKIGKRGQALRGFCNVSAPAGRGYPALGLSARGSKSKRGSGAAPFD